MNRDSYIFTQSLSRWTEMATYTDDFCWWTEIAKYTVTVQMNWYLHTEDSPGEQRIDKEMTLLIGRDSQVTTQMRRDS
jgi:hypothetical protein